MLIGRDRARERIGHLIAVGPPRARHRLGQIYRKLDLRSRTELTALLSGQIEPAAPPA